VMAHRGFRFELDPNKAQRAALASHAGAARFVYNWGLEICKKALEQGQRIPSAYDLINRWNREKNQVAPWWRENSKWVYGEALKDLEQAIQNWRTGRARFPRRKRRKITGDSRARVRDAKVLDRRHVQLPKIGRVRTKERTDRLLELLQAGKARILSAIISREADRWYVSFQCEVKMPDPQPRSGDPVGVDLGLSSFAVTSDGERFEAPKPLEKALRLLRRRSRQASRKQKGSKNHRKALMRLARVHRRVRNIRLDFLHKVTTMLAKAKPVIVVEDLNVKGLGRNWRLSRTIHDVGWGLFRQMLSYKCEQYGSRLIVADRAFPSTRLCPQCGVIGPKLSLSQRTFRCLACGWEADRDLNAAINLRKYGLAALNGPTGRSPGSDACGDPSGGGTALWAGLRATGR